MKQIAVLGLSRFGTSVALSLAKMGVEVLGVDWLEEKVTDLSHSLTHTIQADLRDEEALDSLGLPDFDVVILCIKDIETSCLTTIALKDHGAKKVVAQASSEVHAQILTRLGADKIIMPEKDMGVRVARNLATYNVVDCMELSDTHSLLEMESLEEWVGHTLADSNIRSKYGLNVVAIRTGHTVLVSPCASDIIHAGDILVVIGENSVLDRLTSKIKKK